MEMNLCRFFLLFMHAVLLRDPFIKREGLESHFTGLTMPHFCACSKLGPRFPMLYVVVFLMFNELRREVIAVDGIIIIVKTFCS